MSNEEKMDKAQGVTSEREDGEDIDIQDKIDAAMEQIVADTAGAVEKDAKAEENMAPSGKLSEEPEKKSSCLLPPLHPHPERNQPGPGQSLMCLWKREKWRFPLSLRKEKAIKA